MKPKLMVERGQALILIALAAVGLFGVAGLAIDGSVKFSDRRHAQNAADTAAVAGALAKLVNDPSQPPWNIVAKNRAADNGYDDNLVTNHVEVYSPPVSGIYSNCSDVHFNCNDYVQVIITSHVDTFFARVIGIKQTDNHVEAVASSISQQNNFNFGGNAIVALSPVGCALKAGGTTDVTVNGGGMYSNSADDCAFQKTTCSGNIDVNDQSGNTGLITMVGGYNINYSCWNPANATLDPGGAKQYSFPPPYQEIAQPSVCSSPLTSAPGGTSVTLSPGHYSAMPPRPNIQDTTLQSGVYCIDTQMRLNAGDNISVAGTFGPTPGTSTPGVFLYFKPGGSFTINASSTVHLWGINDNSIAADSSLAPYRGFLMYLAPDYASGTPANCTINGTTSDQLQGTIYAPYCNIKLNGSSDATSFQSQIVGYTVDMTGASGVTLNYDGTNNATWNYPNQVGLTK